MKMAKRMMATLLCLAMLLSGFALADAETETIPAQVEEQDETNLQSGGGHSEPEVTTGSEEHEEEKKDGTDVAASTDSTEDSTSNTTDNSTDNTADDSTDDSTDNSTNNSTDETDPDANLNDSEQDEDGDASDDDADEPENEGGENTPETSPEPGAENGDAETDEEDETDEAEDADAGINLLSLEQEIDLGASNESGCQHTGEKYPEEWDEPTGEIKSSDDNYHEVFFIHHKRVTCLDCGKVIENTEVKSSDLFEHHLTATNGIFACDECDYSAPCEHKVTTPDEEITEPADDVEGYVVSKGPEGHTIKVRKWTQTRCEVCNSILEKGESVVTTQFEAHVWDEEDGAKVCTKCGYANSCTHENVVDVDEWNDIFEAKKVNGDEHRATYKRYANKKCEDCGAILYRDVEIDSWPQTEEHRFEEDLDGKIRCTVCKYEIPCPHPEIEFLIEENVGWKEPKQVDDKTHSVLRYNQVHYRCRDCGKEWGWDYPDYEVKEFTNEPHQWNDEGICKICGYRSQCTEHDFKPVPGSEKDGTYDYRYLDAKTHEIILGRFQVLACTKCGFTMDEFIEGTDSEPIVEDHFWTADGYCAVCGCKGFCQHPAKYVETVTSRESRDDLDPIDMNDETHTVYADEYIRYHCTRCDTWLGYEVTQYGIPTTEPHKWNTNDGLTCLVCGHENRCHHENTTEDFEETSAIVIPELTTAKTHTLDTFVITGTRCTNCGAEFNRVYREELDEKVTEAHKFVRKGDKTVCEVCGYTKPEEKTETKEKTEENPFEEIAAGTVVHGVTVGQPTRMGVTMVQAMAGIAAEYGVDAKIEILNIDKVLTAEECAALNALQPTERILVALSALGYGDEVKNAIAELQLTLSEAARVLNLKVNTRVALMNDAAKVAFQRAIEKYFPNANGVAVTLEIRKAGETAVRKERYGFVQSNGVWTFAKLEVAKA